MIYLLNKKVLQRLNLILKEYKIIEKWLQSNEVNNNIEKLKTMMKNKSDIEEIIIEYKKYLKILNNLEENKNLFKKEKDKELLELLKNEIILNEEELNKSENAIQKLLIPKNPNDKKNVIIEIRGAVGGDEANIFAGDLFRMYVKYADTQKWKVEILFSNESTSGGFANISFMLKGKNVYSKMKYESGAHRVQRIPKTEVKGRVHTSIATVAVLPEVKDVDINISPSDLRIDTYRSSGAGGQHVNTTDSAVRITHIPTGIVVTSQDGRSQHANKEKAMISLRSKIYEKENEKQINEISQIRKDAIGSGERSSKIRTYNYPQNRVTDHRIDLTLQKLDRVMEGALEEIIMPLIANHKKILLEKNF